MESMIIDDEQVYRETVSGTIEEEYIVEKIRSILERYSDETIMVETPVITWMEKECRIEIGGKTIKCHAMPYVEKTSLEAPIAVAIIERGAIIVDKPVQGKIVFIPTPRNLDNIKYIALEMAVLGARAVGFYDIIGGRYRRKVVTGGYYYNTRYGAPPPIPVVSVRREDVTAIEKHGDTKAILHIDSDVKQGVGKTIIGIKKGLSSETIHVSAHHDHWFAGYRDDVAGVETVLRLAKKLHKEKTRHTIYYVLFTAEESGAPNYADWYWGWGSRYMLEIMKNTGEITGITANINIDCVDQGHPCLTGNPVLTRYAETIGVKKCGYDDPDFDSFQYTIHGIPAATLEELDNMLEIYHTDQDTKKNASPEAIDRYVEITYRLLRLIDEKPLSYQPLRKYIIDRLDKAGTSVETKRLIGTIDKLDEKISPREAIRLVTASLTNIIYEPGIGGLFYADIIPEIELVKHSLTEHHYPLRIRIYSLEGVITDNIVKDKETLRKLIQSSVKERINLYLEKLESKLCISM